MRAKAAAFVVKLCHLPRAPGDALRLLSLALLLLCTGALATERPPLLNRDGERFLDGVSRTVRIARDARRNAREDVEATAVQRLQLVQACSATTDHDSLTQTMRRFFSRRE